MNKKFRIYHNPPHIFLDNQIYVVTSCTYKKIPYFNTNEKKSLLYQQIVNAFNTIIAKLFAWAILDNHYHILFELKRGTELSKLIKLINGRSAFEINKFNHCAGRKIWYSYWDTCIRNERDFYMRMNYIHNNPIKHGYVYDIADLEYYEFSSYSYYLEKEGVEWLEDMFRKYPIIDYTEKGEP